jgi:Holliday junction DNA helicase RuvB
MYSESELRTIVKRSAGILNIKITEEGASEIAKRSRGTPRIANRLLKRVRDFAQVDNLDTIEKGIADKGLTALEVDHIGLDATDRKLLLAIIEKFRGGPVGLDTLSSTISEEKDTIEDVYEPFLLQLGFIQKTPRGRCATEAAYNHLSIVRKERK